MRSRRTGIGEIRIHPDEERPRKIEQSARGESLSLFARIAVEARPPQRIRAGRITGPEQTPAPFGGEVTLELLRNPPGTHEAASAAREGPRQKYHHHCRITPAPHHSTSEAGRRGTVPP